ncbi:hypothetical protein C2R22_01955 [Salinigranum rubrum]|uniref:Uncharacterized protein n=1 Tax=Salinigranum rubrum TaxID=755307 RepID=A0A2I8VF72_9EURY|nr:hypothetical protein [Salinigranum rubrum]AUV80577.1 hypothetical protein C2R22_01955 [Salinigranum rubrum]
MDFQSKTGSQDASTDSDKSSAIKLDRETLRRVDHALNGTIDVDLSKLDPDDKLTLLIERYNRKMRELNNLKAQDQ